MCCLDGFLTAGICFFRGTLTKARIKERGHILCDLPIIIPRIGNPDYAATASAGFSFSLRTDS